jgi:hypothetical protein
LIQLPKQFAQNLLFSMFKAHQERAARAPTPQLQVPLHLQRVESHLAKALVKAERVPVHLKEVPMMITSAAALLAVDALDRQTSLRTRYPMIIF